MKRLLLLFCLLSFSTLVFAADDLGNLISKARELRKAGKVQEAKASAEQAVALGEKNQDWQRLWDARQELSFEYRIAGDYDRVLQLRRANLDTVRKNPKGFQNYAYSEQSSVAYLGAAYSWKHDYANAVRYGLEEVALAEAMDRKGTAGTVLAFSLQHLGIDFYLAGQYAEAEKRMRLAYSKYQAFNNLAHPDPREIGQYEFEMEILRWLERVLVAQKRYDEALETSELARSRAFVADLARHMINDKDLTAPTLAKIRAIAQEHNATMVEYSLLYEYDPDLLFQFSYFESIPVATIYIWVVQPDGRITFHESPIAPKGPSLVQMVKGARHSVGAFGRGISVDPVPSEPKTGDLQNLYTLLITPILPDLPREPERVVTFAPQDWLYMVPFAALEDSAGHYLVEQHTINASPSLSILDLTHRELTTNHSGKGLLVVGNPAMPSFAVNPGAPPVRLNQLPQAEAEVRAIAARFHATPLTGQAATKDEVVRRIFNAQIVHFATHGLLDPNAGAFQSALALAPTSDDSGFLTVFELQSLKLNADLVVLSACDTALGKISGDGVPGFSRSFLTAGTPSLMVSLWSVPDESTSYLMEHFYQRLQSGQDKAQSLRGAMLDTKQKFPNPGSWAAFTLLGESMVAPSTRNVTGNADAISREQLNRVAFRFPMPAIVRGLSQTPKYLFEEPVYEFHFDTTMTMQELVSFYKTEMAKRGLKSQREMVEARDFNLLFRGPWTDREVYVDSLESQSWEPTTSTLINTRSVNLHFKVREDDDAEYPPSTNEKLAGIVLPPHATGLHVSEKFQAVDGKADIQFFSALPSIQLRAFYAPIFKKMGWTEYPSGEKKETDRLTVEFHGPQKDRALFLYVEKSFSHPERQEVRIKFDKPSGN